MAWQFATSRAAYAPDPVRAGARREQKTETITHGPEAQKESISMTTQNRTTTTPLTRSSKPSSRSSVSRLPPTRSPERSSVSRPSTMRRPPPKDVTRSGSKTLGGSRRLPATSATRGHSARRTSSSPSDAAKRRTLREQTSREAAKIAEEAAAGVGLTE